jgi:hypothetical protein
MEPIQIHEPVDVMGAARFLKLKPSSVYQLIFQKKLKHYKVNNRKIYFKLSDLQDYVFNKDNEVAPQK